MEYSPILNQLIEDLRCLPGVGPKSAQRMAFHLLEQNREAAKRLAASLISSVESIQHCRECRSLTEYDICTICSNPKRLSTQLCIVESPSDIYAIEQATDYKGRYFVLMGHLSPIDGIGPEQLGLKKLESIVERGNVEEVILATNPTVEGEATAHYIGEILGKYDLTISRIAHGVPLGGELEYVDGGTLSHAFQGRRKV